MKLQELISELERVKNSSDVKALQEEKERLDKALERLRRAEELAKRLRDNLELCRRYDFEEVKAEVNEILKALLNPSEGPEALGELITSMYERSQACVKSLNQIRERVLAEYRQRLEELNKKLMVYARVFRNVLGKEVEVTAFDARGDVEEVRREVERAEEEAIKLNQRLKEEVKSSGLSPEYVDLLVEIVDKGEVVLTKRNKDKLVKLVEFLVDRGVPVRVKI